MLLAAVLLPLTAGLPLWATVPAVPKLPAPSRQGYVEQDGARLYYAVFHPGSGKPVLLLHGGLASSESWGFEVPRLVAEGYSVIVMDARGHGRSTLGNVPLDYGRMADDAIAVMDAAGVAKASVVGLSDGGVVALLLGIHHPRRVDRLFVWGATFDTNSDSTAPPDQAMKGMGPLFMARMQAQYRAMSPTPDGFPALRAALGDLYRREPHITPAELGSLRAPTVVADGGHEQFIARAHTEQLASLIPGARLIILPDVSHGGPQQDPASFDKAVLGLLSAQPPGP